MGYLIQFIFLTLLLLTPVHGLSYDPNCFSSCMSLCEAGASGFLSSSGCAPRMCYAMCSNVKLQGIKSATLPLLEARNIIYEKFFLTYEQHTREQRLQ